MVVQHITFFFVNVLKWLNESERHVNESERGHVNASERRRVSESERRHADEEHINAEHRGEGPLLKSGRTDACPLDGWVNTDRLLWVRVLIYTGIRVGYPKSYNVAIGTEGVITYGVPNARLITLILDGMHW